jgi:hypothetical protein
MSLMGHQRSTQPPKRYQEHRQSRATACWRPAPLTSPGVVALIEQPVLVHGVVKVVADQGRDHVRDVRARGCGPVRPCWAGLLSSGAVSWKLWREVSGFWPCYTGVFSGDTGVFSGDGRTVKGAWEGSAEGPRREHDFDLNYVSVVT